jgi:hypothetical protein
MIDRPRRQKWQNLEAVAVDDAPSQVAMEHARDPYEV